MKMLILTTQLLAEVDALNEASPVHKVAPVELADGRFGLPAELLTDDDAGQPFAKFKTFLSALNTEDVTPPGEQDEPMAKR